MQDARGAKIIILEEVDLLSLLYLLISPKYAEAWYFQATPSFEAVYPKLKSANIIKADIKRLRFNVSELREKDGTSSYARIISKDYIDVCNKIRKEILLAYRPIKTLASAIGNEEKVSLYILKRIMPDIRKLLIYVNVISWQVDSGTISRSAKVDFAVRNNLFLKVLSGYAAHRGIDIRRRFFGFKKTLKGFSSVFLSSVALPLKYFLQYIITKENANSVKNIKPDRNLSVFYSGREVTFDLKKRCDFFWLLKSDELHRKTLIYSVYPEFPVNEEEINELERHGIKFVPFLGGITDSPKAPIWRPTFAYFKILFGLNLKTYISICKDLLRGNFTFIELGGDIFNFNRWYALWFDFFKSLDLKVNFNPPDYDPMTIIVNLAVENAGGISLSYQIADFETPDLDYCSCTNVFFSFGPYYKEKLKESEAFTDNFIFCGYLTDYVFKELKESSTAIRRALSDKGAEFVIAYFDENSSDNDLALIKNKAAASIYRALLERVIEDKKLGLICKPKKPRTLRKRLPETLNLMNEAIETGRCIFIDEGDYISSVYPAEAAKASDIAIGIFRGGTTALESFLAGTPTIYLDLEKIYSDKFYGSAKRELIFDDLETLFKIIDNFRKDQNSRNHMRELFEETIRGKDPFRDGMASERMSVYIRHLLESLEKGLNREEAIEYANRLYRERWGSDKVLNMRM